MLYPQHDGVSQDYPDLSAKEKKLAGSVSVARVRPRTSKGITDLLLPQTSSGCNAGSPSKKRARDEQKAGVLLLHHTRIRLIRSAPFCPKLSPSLFSRLRSRSLSELTRQIPPPTKNGHAPPPIESRKSSQSVNPHYVWTW